MEAIYSAYEDGRNEGFREHLGASLIGKPCERALWYDFRWVTAAQHSGRILRLFQTGHLEEERLVRDLRASGATVLEVDPETGRQFKVEALSGHFGGSLDGLAVGLRESPRTWHVLEFKTHSAKSYAQLVAKGVAASKPQHAAQMQIYMHLMGLTRAFYLAVCKDTDALYAERIEADPAQAERLLAKASRIIDAARPPSRISEDPAWFECRMCSHRAVCHEGAMAAVNCRTCLHSTPVEGGWHCARHDRMRDFGQQLNGCRDHLFIPDLVNGEVIDATENFVVYRMKNGTDWVNVVRGEEESE
ncbi:PD-(D/E)XK nuclease family protein [Aestuariivirga sp.]|uniref:PD-(D/E)XK nuclease family protein n=1 Tax=Aestuariivirga sp. TaxID=2650926 RepID=UPI0037830E63